ncbi:uncharacterized protein PODANS_7_4720 [Podospora anserina S mat+]|uniref:Podospora anserina S mat+ genomic DNA chromosome 7, supercontig 1 n=1 Tax=Podospora anserina (strain S / ATCC MYA-4624 / DSM 980 / FGSC 10383) TaxID=515849 RepID=B2AUY2_PODAN|nr:uncharacterized protein PODANS_7_4720 [Podospora anserina S mat+]CAP68205.1 unnamed protein product [Podospora anserina S mat+]CDP31675.1 Putative type IB cation-transporting ATPase [Podospora anserina S mat+]
MSATAFRSRTTPRHAWSLTAARVKHCLAVTSLVWTVSPCVLAMMVAQNTRLKICSPLLSSSSKLSLKLIMPWTKEQTTLWPPCTQDKRFIRSHTGGSWLYLPRSVSSWPGVLPCCPAAPKERDGIENCQESCCDVKQQTPAQYGACAGSSATSHHKDRPTLSSTAQHQVHSGSRPGGPTCCHEGPSMEPMRTTLDREQGLSTHEHIVLSITGMTCTGCETKLHRTLGTFPSIKNLKTSLVLSRAEFDLEKRSLVDVMRHVERTTEFKCERVKKGASVDVIVPGGASAFMGERWPKGVTDMALVNDTTVNISYDPQLVGARDLAERGWGVPVELAPPQPDASLSNGSRHVKHIGLMTLASILLTIPVLVLAWAPLHGHEIAYESGSLALATLVQFLVAGPFYPKALKALVFSRVIEMDLLIVLSTSAAYVFSVVSFAFLVTGEPLSTGSFFETSTLLVTLIMVGRYVAALARQKAVESISIRSLQVNTAILVDFHGDHGREIDTRLLQLGDIFKVMPESRIPTDGTTLAGTSEVDGSMVTGESRPVVKSPGSPVIAGTSNGLSPLLVRVTRNPGDNTIDTIAAMVDEAKLSKPTMQRLADRVASYFVPVISLLMIITFAIWIAVGIRVRGVSAREAIIEAVTYAITVLIVCCPCAIGLAVPMVVVITTGVGAEHGVIFKSAESIEVAYQAKYVILDRTGTLTEGKLSVVYYDGTDGELVNMSLLLELLESTKHPVSLAVATFLKDKGVLSSTVQDIRSLPGKGVQGLGLDGQILQAGNVRWLDVESDLRVQMPQEAGHTVFCFTIDGKLAAVFGLQDTLRKETATTIQSLQNRNVAVHVLSGDDDGPVWAVTDQLGIPCSNVRSRCTPADKKSYVEDILSRSPESVVIFCGDGTNDAVALAQATVGIAISRSLNSTAELAESAADIVLMRPDLKGILTVMDLSRKSVHRIIFNFTWSFAYNLFAVLLAAGAFMSLNNARIPPEFAGLGELVSVLPVILAALLLKRARF